MRRKLSEWGLRFSLGRKKQETYPWKVKKDTVSTWVGCAIAQCDGEYIWWERLWFCQREQFRPSRSPTVEITWRRRTNVRHRIRTLNYHWKRLYEGVYLRPTQKTATRRRKTPHLPHKLPLRPPLHRGPPLHPTPLSKRAEGSGKNSLQHQRSAVDGNGARTGEKTWINDSTIHL